MTSSDYNPIRPALSFERFRRRGSACSDLQARRIGRRLSFLCCAAREKKSRSALFPASLKAP